MSVFREALRLRPDYAIAHYHLGRELLKTGEKDEGITELRKAIDLDPEAALFRYDLGVALMDAGYLDEAKTELHEVLRL